MALTLRMRNGAGLPAAFLQSLLLGLPLLLALAAIAAVEGHAYSLARRDTVMQARTAAQATAGMLAARLDQQFVSLHFAASVLGGDTDLRHPSPQTQATLRRLISTHPTLFAFNIQSGNGARILWSTWGSPGVPLNAPEAFHRVPACEDCLLGRPAPGRRFGGEVLPMRVSVRDGAGNIAYMVGAPYRLDALLAGVSRGGPWGLHLLDARTAHEWSIPGSAPAPERRDGVVVEPLPGYAFMVVRAAWDPALVRLAYARAGWPRWVAEGGMIALLLGAAYGLALLLHGRARNLRRQQRLTRFNAMLAQINQIVGEASDETAMMQALCEVAVAEAGLRLAWIARPDAEGAMQTLAAAGVTGYLQEARFSSDPASPFGQGNSGRVWRSGKACFQGSFASASSMAPWRAAARRFGLVANAVIPIRRAGEQWALLSVYDGQSDVFDAETQDLLEETALDIGRGLDRLDLLQRERAAQEFNSFLASHDELTGLPNRRALMQQLDTAVARAARTGTLLAVGMIDLDDFKPINDDYGHEAGDALLQELAQRLRRHLRPGDGLARLGGDEFAVVIEGLDALRAMEQLGALLETLHAAVESPFTLASGHAVTLEMSMGLALFKLDADAPDTLLRQADIALYRQKAHKRLRSGWWRVGADVEDEAAEPAFDPYGGHAVDLLARVEPNLQKVARDYAEAFYAELVEDPRAARILEALDADELRHLENAQTVHLSQILSARTQRQTILDNGQRYGRTHALTGVDGALMLHALSLLRRLLIDRLAVVPLSGRQRYWLQLALDVRLQDDVQAQLLSAEATIEEYTQLLASPLPAMGALWTDVSRREVEALGARPAVRGCAVLRPDSAGLFLVEASGGTQAAAVRELLGGTGARMVGAAPSDQGLELLDTCWRSGQIANSAACGPEACGPAMREALRGLGIRSAAAVPIRDERGHPLIVLLLLGAFPSQFDSGPMRQFLHGLQQRWSELWQRARMPAGVLSEDLARAYRQRLFSGGLRMHMQPVVDLRSGAFVRVEALARLGMDDGRLVPPGSFLQALGDADLDRLFRLGLHQALQAVAQWQQQGLRIDVSVNLPPSTLLDPSVAQWIGAALTENGVDARRLTLELLELQDVDGNAQNAAIASLTALGVKLAMDDLGSGYSSLQRLSTLPFAQLKVDQGITSLVHRDPVRVLSLISAIVQMGLDFDQDVVIEGLEDAGMIEAGWILGAHYGQGYGLARPMPAEAVLDWSRAFQGPAHEAGRIRTNLGALAYLWRSLRQRNRPLDGSAERCPLGRFLHDEGLDGTDADTWHRQMHAAGNPREPGAKLLEFLQERIRGRVAAVVDGDRRATG